MKRLALSAALALGLHVTLFLLGARLLPHRPARAYRATSITVTLAYLKQPEVKKNKKKETIPPSPKSLIKKPLKERRNKVKKTPAKTKPKKPVPLKPPNTVTNKKKTPAQKKVHEKVMASVGAKTETRPRSSREVKNSPEKSYMRNKESTYQPEEFVDIGATQASSSRASSGGSDILRTARPAYMKNPAPPYPVLARRRGYEGLVLLEVLVTREGRVAELRVKKSSGYKVLDRAAVKAVKNWLFEPGVKNGTTIDMWVEVPVRFRLN